MSLRRCQAILRLERVVVSLPHVGEALRFGEISLSKVEALSTVATDATEAFWLDRARHLSVADLREEIRVARARAAPLSGEPPGAADVMGPRADEATSPAPDRAPAPIQALAVDDRVAGGGIEQDEPGCLLAFAAPAPVFAIWHWTLDLVRRVAGRQEPAWRCAEYLAAEFLSGVPDVSPESARAARPKETASLSRAAAKVAGKPMSVGSEPDRYDAAAWSEACDAVREALASFGAAADVDTILGETPASSGDERSDAWGLDAGMRRLARLRQSLAWRQGRLLAAFTSTRLYRELGFGCFDDWIDERLPMSPRRARYLVSLERRLRRLPLLKDAYRRGLITWCHARLLARVVAPASESRWIRFARRVTVRRLEDAVVSCEMESANPAHVGALPLPPEDPPTGRAGSGPAGPASLHTSASPHGSASLHTSALTSAPQPASAFLPVLAPQRDAPAGRHACRRIVFWAPLDVAALWDSALRACRASARARLDDWECLLRFVRVLRDTWENPDDPQWKRRYRIFERDGWRCMAPGCTSRSGLNEHHIVFRSQQGSDDDENLVTLCVGHHQEGLHAGRVRCFGRAPESLWWDLGVRPDGEPLVRYFGETIVTSRRPYVPRASPGVAGSG